MTQQANTREDVKGAMAAGLKAMKKKKKQKKDSSTTKSSDIKTSVTSSLDQLLSL